MRLDEFYDAAVSGADPIDKRPGFVELVQRLATNVAKTLKKTARALAGPRPPLWPNLLRSRLSLYQFYSIPILVFTTYRGRALTS
jgi:hypothetical protein